MIKRIVKLTFHPQLVPEFLALFEETKDRIRHFSGCLHLELLQEAGRPDVFFTLSIWQDEAALNAYRDSDLFQDTWARTKALFRDKPEAWSLNIVSEAAD